MYLHNSTGIFYKKLAETHKRNKCTISARLRWQQQGDLPKWCFVPSRFTSFRKTSTHKI